MFAVIPFNSPPGFPQFNGVMERSQGEIKRYLRAILKDREELDSFAVAVHLSVEQANQHCELSLFFSRIDTLESPTRPTSINGLRTWPSPEPFLFPLICGW